MLSQSLIENILDEAMMRGADFAEVFDENTLFHESVVTQEHVEKCQSGRESGVGIRIFSGTECYYGYTNNKTEQALYELTKGLTKAVKSQSIEKVLLKEKEIFCMDNRLISASSLSMKKRLEPVYQTIQAGMNYDSDIVRMEVKRTDMEQCVQIANTEGIFLEDQRVKTRLYICAYAQNNMDTQTGYIGPGAMRGHEYYHMIDLDALGQEAARRARTILFAKPCRGGQMNVIVNNGFGGLLFHEACGHSLEATCIAQNSSEFCGKLGKKVASDVVTLVDDGTIDHEWGSLHVDDEGIPTQKNILIENGILKSYMVDRLNGLRANLKPTGSARRRNYKFAPVARMTNTYIAPGISTPEEIIANTEYGLYVSTINGGSVDPATGDFNFNAGECYLVENGKITIPVRGITLVGNGGAVLKNVDMVGNDFEMCQGFCYAESGPLFVGVGQPTVRIKQMTVGGIA